MVVNSFQLAAGGRLVCDCGVPASGSTAAPIGLTKWLKPGFEVCYNDVSGSSAEVTRTVFRRRFMETLLSICVGIGLAAACGFRVFVPLLLTSIAAMAGHVTLATHFQWIGTYPALITFSVATLLEVAGYYIPWVDHLLDTVATPAAIVAGTVLTASMLTDVSPLLRWSLAVIAGGGVAGVVQSGTILTRAVSTTSSGGLANPVVSTAELGLSVVASVLAIFLPLVSLVAVTLLMVFLGKRAWKQCKPARSLNP